MHSKNELKRIEYLKETQQLFLTIGVSMSDEDVLQLINYQQLICQKLDWIELERNKVDEIINLFLNSRFIHGGNYMDVLLLSINIYYQLRSQFDYHISDDMLCKVIKEEFEKSTGMNLAQLQARVDKKLKERGGQYRNKQHILIYG